MDTHSHSDEDETSSLAKPDDTSVAVVAKAEVQRDKSCYLPVRHVLAALCFLAMFNVYAIRSCLSVAIVAMVNSTAPTGADTGRPNGTVLPNECPDRGYNATKGGLSSNGVFNWNAAQQGLLLGSFFYGYMCNNILGPWLSKRFGFKRVMGSAMLISGALTACIPPAAYASFGLLVAVRMLTGFFQGVFSPSVVGVWGVWGPRLERSALTSFSLSGSSVGTFVTMPLAGVLAETFGWESVFYVIGGLSLGWCAIWFALVHDSPEQHPRISDKERCYILGNRAAQKESQSPEKQENRNETPWKSMLTSPPLMAILAGIFASSWGTYTALTLLPTYMATILKFDLAMSGTIVALPYIIQCFLTMLSGFLTDVIRSKRIMSTIAIRKVNTALALVGSGLFCVFASYVGCDVTLAVTFFSISVALAAFIVPGSTSNAQDIAPNFSGIIYGISNTLGGAAGVLAPQVAGWLLVEDSSLRQWQTVFWISAGVQIFCTVLNLLFASGDEQPWSRGDPHKKSRGDSPSDVNG